MINYSNNDVIVAPDGKWLDFRQTQSYPYPEYHIHLYNNTVDKQIEICGMNVKPYFADYLGQSHGGSLPGKYVKQMTSVDDPYIMTMGPTICHTIRIYFSSSTFERPIDAITWYESFTQEGLVEGGFDSANIYGVISYGNEVLLGTMGPITNAVNVQRTMVI